MSKREALLQREYDLVGKQVHQERRGDAAWNAGRHQEACIYYTNARRARREAERMRRLIEQET